MLMTNRKLRKKILMELIIYLQDIINNVANECGTSDLVTCFSCSLHAGNKCCLNDLRDFMDKLKHFHDIGM